jgi:uncharacterized OB-fold protein
MKKWPYENLYYRMKDDQPYLFGCRCNKCNHVVFPAKDICPACAVKGTMEEIPLSKTGKVDTFSVLYVAAPGFPVPYVVGYVRLPEGPRAFSVIQADEEEIKTLEIGREVELVLGKINTDEQGDEVMGYQFRVIKGK